MATQNDKTSSDLDIFEGLGKKAPHRASPRAAPAELARDAPPAPRPRARPDEAHARSA